MVTKTYIYSLLLSILLVSASSCSSDDNANISPPEPETTLELATSYGGTKNESAQSIITTTDGGYAILGFSQSADGDITDKQNESFDYWVLKFDANHNLSWSKTYGGSLDDRGQSIIQTLDGGYAILGYSSSNDEDISSNAGSQDYWLAKLDASGNLTWQVSYGYSGADIGYSLLQTSDGGYLLTGVLDVTASGGAGNTRQSNFRHAGGDYWVLKLDSSGNREWSKYYGGSFTDTPFDAIETSDGNFIIVGSSDSNDIDISNNLGTYDFWVLKISSTGTLIWEKSFGGSEIDEARAIAHSGDGNFMILGDTRSDDINVSNNYGAADLWLIKMSPDGDLIWEKSFGGTSFDVGRSIQKTTENNFIVSGSSRSADGNLTNNQGQNDAWFLKLDSNATIIWQKTVGGSEIDFCYDAIELQNQTIIAVGESSSSDGDLIENKGFTDLLIIRSQ